MEDVSRSTLESIVSHFQTLFDVPRISGIFPRMNDIYRTIGESKNVMNTLKSMLGLGQSLHFSYKAWILRFNYQVISHCDSLITLLLKKCRIKYDLVEVCIRSVELECMSLRHIPYYQIPSVHCEEVGFQMNNFSQNL